jgi:hypothetical protein
MASRVPLLLGLSDDLLTSILALLDQETKCRVLPLVCSRFRRLLQQPGSWQEVTFTERRMAALAEELRLRLFLAWAHRISRGLRQLKVDVPADLDDEANAVLLTDLSSVLGQAAPSLQLLELKCRYSLDAQRVLPPLLQSQLRALTELHLLAEDRIQGLQLASLSSLQRLNIVVDGEPPESLDAESTLPPSITWLGLTPAPLVAEPGAVGIFSKAIPPCVCALPRLEFLDISESRGLTGLHTALRQLTLLTGLVRAERQRCMLPLLPSTAQHCSTQLVSRSSPVINRCLASAPAGRRR